MKNLFLWIGVVLIIASTVIAQLTGIEVASWIEMAGLAIGLASCISGIINKSEKKDWKLYVSIIGITLSSCLLVFAGITESTITTIITTVSGLAVMIIGILPVLLQKKKDSAE